MTVCSPLREEVNSFPLFLPNYRDLIPWPLLLNRRNFVGLAISRDRQKKSITISQPYFVDKIIDLYSIPSSTAKYPMSEDFLTSSKTVSDLPLLPLPLQTLFQEKIGNILYLASHTRPDLLYATAQLSRKSNKATSKDMSAADKLLPFRPYFFDPWTFIVSLCICRFFIWLLFR